MTPSDAPTLTQRLVSLYPKSTYLKLWMENGRAEPGMVTRLLAAEHLREDCSSDPWHAKRAKAEEMRGHSQIDYWISLKASEATLNRRPGQSFTVEDLKGEVSAT